MLAARKRRFHAGGLLEPAERIALRLVVGGAGGDVDDFRLGLLLSGLLCDFGQALLGLFELFLGRKSRRPVLNIRTVKGKTSASFLPRNTDAFAPVYPPLSRLPSNNFA